MSCQYRCPNLLSALSILKINEFDLHSYSITQLRHVIHEKTKHVSYSYYVSIIQVLRAERRRIKKKNYAVRDDKYILAISSEISELEEVRDKLILEKEDLEKEILLYSKEA